ncbi:hypothetical protein QSH57_010134 [Fusarium oxysporum f. sp. vasinfectum]|nr:hypothetical protein QSH57_010134 [Fusarium oxysporum f. sp. vasinfectum]
MATLLSSTSSTAISPTTFLTTTTSAVSAPTPCNQLNNPSYIDGVELSLFCGKQATGGNQIDYSNQLHSLTECMTLCADTLACRAVTFDNVGNECTLYDGFNGFMSDFNLDMAVVASRPVTSSTTEPPTAFSTTTSLSTTSTTAPSGPLSCSQMADSIYTGPHENKFTLSCDTSSTGESIYRRDEEDSMQGCLDRCDNDSRCIAVNFHPYPYSECDLIESFTGTKSTPSTNFASKVLSSVSTSTSSETSIPIGSTSESTASSLYTTPSASISSGEYVSGYTGVAIIYNYISCSLTSRYLITHKIASIYIIIIITRRAIWNYIGHCSGVYNRVNITFISVNYNLTSSYLIINNIVIIYITRPFIIVIVRVYVGCHIGIHIS